MKELVTPRQAAEALGVSEASLKRWCDRGLLPAIRTAGGHRRLPINGVVQFIRDRGQPLARPEVLGLPRATGRSEHTLDRIKDLMRGAIEAGDEEQCRRLVFNLYLAGHHTHEIGDLVIASSFREIGRRWSHGEVEVYEERRGVEVCTRALFQLRMTLPDPAISAPTAIGATLEGDPYTLATNLVELTLREGGWRAQNYGIGLPAETLCAAIDEVKPALFWLSVSTISDPHLYLRQHEQVYQAATRRGTALVVGGRALTEDLRHEMRYSAYCDTLSHLASFAATLRAVPGA